MSMSIDYRTSTARSILAPVIVLGLVAVLGFLAVTATETAGLSSGGETAAYTTSGQHDRTAEVFLHREAIAMP